MGHLTRQDLKIITMKPFIKVLFIAVYIFLEWCTLKVWQIHCQIVILELWGPLRVWCPVAAAHCVYSESLWHFTPRLNCKLYFEEIMR